MNPGHLKIKLEAVSDASFTVMFEASGMTYDLGPSEFMYAEISAQQVEAMEIIYWNGGITIVPPGPVTTFDASGNELHYLHY
jgi:hypothetical protein